MADGRGLSIAEPRVDPEAEALVVEVLRSGRLSQGPMVELLEGLVAAAVGVRHAVATCNGTMALVAGLRAADVGPGDEVITTPFTFGATAHAITAVGAAVRFADVSAADGTLCPDAVRAAIGPRTAAILPVHLFGHPADMTALVEIANRHGLALVEDAAQALGAAHAGLSVGAFGVGVFSFYATKNVTTGEGGMVTTDDDVVASSLRRYRNQGMGSPYEYLEFGLNSRMSDVHAAIGIPQVRRLPEITSARNANADRLSVGLDGVPGVERPTVRVGDVHAFHQYTIRVTDEAKVDRDTLVAELAARRVGAAVYYPRVLPSYECFRSPGEAAAEHFPEASRLSRQAVSLPVHPGLTDVDIDRIVTAVRSVLG